MITKSKKHYGYFLFVSLLSVSRVVASDQIKCEFVAYHKKWKIPSDEATGKILLAWEISNHGGKHQRFRIRDLGKIILTDSNGKVRSPTMLGVDSTKAFQITDYPLIGPHETIYFPFIISFFRQENGLYTLKLRNSPEGDEGWHFEDLQEGKYSMVGIYSSKKTSIQKNHFLWEAELKYLKSNFIDDFWEGEVSSTPINVSIIN